MASLQERIELMLSELGWGSAELARAADVTVGAVSQWKSGNTRNLKSEVVMRLAATTGYSPTWIATGKGPKKMADTGIVLSLTQKTEPLAYAGKPREVKGIPVVGQARMGDDGYYTEFAYPVGHGDGCVEGASTDPNAYALRVRGDSMSPAIEDGYYILVEPNGTCVPGEKVVIVMKDERKMCKKFLYERPDTVSVQSINGGTIHTLEKSEIEHMHPVAAVISPSKWRPA